MPPRLPHPLSAPASAQPGHGRSRRPTGLRAPHLIALAALLPGLLAAPRATAQPASDARADAPSDTPSGAVVVWGSAGTRPRAVARRAVEDELRRVGWALLAIPADDEDRLTTCFRSEAPWPCLAPLVAAQRLGQVLALQVEREPSSAGAQLRLTGQLGAAATGRVTLDFRYCAPCQGEAQLAEAASALASHLLSEGAVRGAATRIVVRTWPPGATIHLDGRMIDAPRNELAASPGLHTLFLQLAGHRSELRTVRVEEGERARVEVRFIEDPPGGAGSRAMATTPLIREAAGASGAGGSEPSASAARRAATTAPTRTSSHRRRALAWALFASGATALAAGGILLALDEDPDPDPRRDHQPRLLDSAPAGVALGVGGAALLLAGALVWPRTDGAPPAPRALACARGASAPATTSAPGLWLVTWRAAF